MRNQCFFFLKCIFFIFVLSQGTFLFVEDANIRGNGLFLAGLTDIDDEKNIHSSFDESNESYFPNNPMELMNVLRSIESMNDGTSPSDAIDDALKAFETQEQLDSSFDADK